MSDCCFEIRARSEGRAKRPRDQAGALGMEISNQSNEGVTSNDGGGGDKMEVEPCSNQANGGDRSSGESHKSNYKNGSSPKQVTDDSCSNESCSSQGQADTRQPQHQPDRQNKQGAIGNGQPVQETGKDFQKQSEMKRAGPVMEDDRQSSASIIPSPSLPQHERIQHVEPLDINYRSTPACLKLREILTSRLRLIAPSGRIQVVSRFGFVIVCSVCYRISYNDKSFLSAALRLCIHVLITLSLTKFISLRLIFQEEGLKRMMQK